MLSTTLRASPDDLGHLRGHRHLAAGTWLAALSRSVGAGTPARSLRRLDPDVVPVDGALARRTAVLFQPLGMGRGHTARLNFGDCFAAALAEREPLPLVVSGDDFSAAGF